MKIDFSALEKKWPSTLVCRDSIGQLTGGLIQPGTIRNKEKEIGLTKMKHGKKVFYYVTEIIAYLRDSSEIVQGEGQGLDSKFEAKV
ncbi:MAG: hypothetical protein SCH71_17015 [Desulfobulbaceae bacterium]|nr:hypothetical protein [Desulfobulbaceae bacterium]